MQYIKSLLLVGLCASMCACSTYRGAGEYKSGADLAREEGDQRQPSSISTAEHKLGFVWPVNKVRITQGFEPAKNPRHKGLDIGGYRGMPINASNEGRVIYTGHGFHGYGNMVLIEHENGLATLYAHLQKIKIKKGATVSAGTLIGLMGRTGHATGVHLHFEVMKNRQPVDPLLFMNEPRFLTSK